MTQPSQLIAAKLEPPRIRRGFIDRPSLLVRLDHSLEGRVTLISAPAGYGKSTLVAQWLDGESAPLSAWLSLDRLDSDLERFTRYVVTALRRAQPECLPRTEELLDSPTLPPPEYLAETMVAEISEFRQRVVLVLDDYASIREELVHELMDLLVQKLPESLHLVALSRVDPPLPVALWQSRHWLHELRGVDLRFSRDEAGAFFEAADDLHLSDDAIDTLHRKTEGWIAGLRLALLSLSGSADPEERVREFSGSERLITDYLMAEALGAQSPEVREFLALTAPLERFCAPLCDHLSADRPGAPDTRRMIDRIERANVFLFPLGPAGGWYRYHHLFRELLLDRFDELAPPMSREEISRRAGGWFSREGWLEEGIQYLLAANDLDGAADLVAENLHDTINRDLSRRTLVRWLALFPPGAKHGRLPLIVASLYIMILKFEFEAMLQLLEEAERTCRDLECARGRKWWQDLQPDLAALRAYAAFWHGDSAAAVEHGAAAMKSTNDPRGYQYSLVILYLGAGLALEGRRSEALQFLDEGIDRTSSMGSPHLGLYLVVRAFVHMYWGELEPCRVAALEGLKAGDRLGAPKYFSGHAHLALGSVAYERNQLDEAEAHFGEVTTQRFDANPMIYHEALIGLGLVALARGDLASIERFSAEARAHATDAGGPLLQRHLEVFERRVAAVSGSASTPFGLPPAATDFMFVSVYPPSYNWAWAQANDPATETRSAALGFIDQALAAAEAHGVERRMIQLSILRAMALDSLEQRDDAISVLEGALQRGVTLGFVRSFVDGGEPVRKLLQVVVERHPDNGYAASLLDAFAVPPQRTLRQLERPAATGSISDTTEDARLRDTSVGAYGAPFEELTNRELDVLELLGQRMTNKEIAARLGISAGTVKMHAINVYRKLGVRGRRQAVAAAIELGIFSD